MRNPIRSITSFLATPHVQTGLAVGAAAAIEANQPSLLPRPRTDQALVVAGSFASGYVAGSGYAQATDRITVVPGVPNNLVTGAGSAAFAAALDSRMGSSRVGAATVTAARVKSYASTAAIVVALAHRGAAAVRPHGRVARGGAALAAATAIGAGAHLYLKDRLGRYEADDRIPPDGADVAWTLAVGTGIATGVGSFVMAERYLARSAAAMLGRAVGGPAAAWAPVTHALFGGAVVLGARTGYAAVLAKISASNSRTEARYAEPPAVPTVSGGPGSVVAFEDLGLQGRRFVLEASPGSKIDEVLGESGAVDAVRVFIGVESAPTIEERVALAIEELRRTGAFDRSLLVIGSPAGTGYFNYIPVEAAEYLTRGDVASVAIQYGALPSMLSMSKVPVAIEQHAALLRAVNEELSKRDSEDRPRVVLYGESLGAQTSQGAFIGGGTRILDDLGIDRALWAGTPYASRWRRELLAGGPDVDPSVFGTFRSIDDYRSLPEDDRASIRFFFLNHDEDPVTRFGLDLAYRRPDWLGDPATRLPTISKTQQWVPAVTFFQTAIDTKNAATVVPGEFKALGHDYRADLAAFVSAAYGLTNVTDEQMGRIEERLRRSEVERAAKIADG